MIAEVFTLLVNANSVCCRILNDMKLAVKRQNLSCTGFFARNL